MQYIGTAKSRPGLPSQRKENIFMQMEYVDSSVSQCYEVLIFVKKLHTFSYCQLAALTVTGAHTSAKANNGGAI